MKWNKKEVLCRLFEVDKRLKRRPVKRDDPLLFYLSKRYFGSWNKMMKCGGYEIKYFRDVKIPSTNSRFLYYFIGLLCTDGHIVYDKVKKKYKVLICNSNEDEKSMIIKLMKFLFKYPPSIRKKKYGYNIKPNYEVHIYSKKLCEFLVENLKIPFGNKSLTIKIPRAIKYGNPKQIGQFLRGVIDGDGSIIKTKKCKLLKITSGSKEFIFGINELLRKFDIVNGKINKEKENLWILRLNRKEDIKRLYRFVYGNCEEYCYIRKKRIWEQYI
jgi:DNA-binding transcriptional regulator WhiA